MKKYDVFGIGNALVDCVILVTEKFLEENNIEKGVMTLVDDEKQKSIIEKIKNSDPFFRLGAKYKSEIRAKAQMNITHKNLFILGANPCIQHKVYLFVQ